MYIYIYILLILATSHKVTKEKFTNSYVLLILVTSHKVTKTKFLIKPKQLDQRLWSHKKVTDQ